MLERKNKKTDYTVFNYIFYLIIGFAVRLLIRIILDFTLEEDAEVSEWKKHKKGFIMLCTHPSEFDAVLLLSACLPNRTRFVAGAQQLYKGLQGMLLRWLKVIPKKQFVADISSVKEMISTVKSGMILGMMPEGRVSLDGTENPNDISTAKLIKKLGVPVALLKPEGTFFVKPSYNWAALIKGKISADVKCFLTEDEIAAMTAEDILGKLKSECVYNESEALRGSGKTFGKKNRPCMEKVSNILYRCPSCRRLYTMRDENSRLFCSECGLGIRLLPDMFFEMEKDCRIENSSGSAAVTIPDNIAAWNRSQLEYEKEFWSSPDARLEYSAEKFMLTLGRETDYRQCEKGILSLDRQGFHYSSEAESVDAALSILPGVSADYMNGYITYYSGDDIRRFALENPQYAARFVNSLMTLKKSVV